MIGRRFVLFSFLLIAAATLVGCGGGGGPKVEQYTFRFTGAENLNNCSSDFANTLVVRVYQLKSDEQITIADLADLWQSDEELGADFVRKDEVVVVPNEQQELEVLAGGDVKFLAVVGNFCETDGDCWRWISPMEGLDSTIKISCGATCLSQSN
ncbi:MAG: type VI secretion system lipoprotein TssJ [Candidatus Eisenbacteria bacterium]|uniref:Type VI secretion system lipoprotein TssJ n=1 Tax=Eiseniibacteriota bacterium TaxID=2212470 RepID=A0A7Y2EBE2_UNCEI|nr:type VI secretion system lipoprotein TssJ [Candidatus Eisenbacteria bacterium]